MTLPLTRQGARFAVGTENGSVRAFDADGEELWSQDGSSRVSALHWGAPGLVVGRLDDTTLLSDDGSRRWWLDLPGQGVAISPGAVFVLTVTKISVLQIETGRRFAEDQVGCNRLIAADAAPVCIRNWQPGTLDDTGTFTAWGPAQDPGWWFSVGDGIVVSTPTAGMPVLWAES